MGDAGPRAGVPEVARRRRGDVAVGVSIRTAALRKVLAAASAVVRGPELLGGVGRVGAGREGVAVVADFGVDVEVVEEDEVARQGVRVGRHVFAEETERGLAFADRQIAEDLVVGPVLANHVEHVPDRRRLAHAERDRRRLRRAGGSQPVRVAIGTELVGPAREFGERRLVRDVDARERSGEEAADVLPLRSPGAGLRSARIGLRCQALAGDHEDAFAVGGEARPGRIPADREEAFHPRFARRDVDDRDRVVVGVRDEERAAVRRKPQGVGRAPRRRLRLQGDRDPLGHLSRGQVHAPDRIRARAGDEDGGAVAREHHGRRMLADLDLALDGEARRIHEQDPGAAPERDQEGLPVLRQEACVRFGGQRHHALDASRFQIDRGERESERIDDEESAPVGRDVEPGEKARRRAFRRARCASPSRASDPSRGRRRPRCRFPPRNRDAGRRG